MNNRYIKNIFNRAIKAILPSKRMVVYTVLFTFIFQNMMAVCACAMQDIEVEVRRLPGRFTNLKTLKSIDGKLVSVDDTDAFVKTLSGFEVRMRQLDKEGTTEWESSEHFRQTDSGNLTSVATSSKSGPSRIAAVPKHEGIECSLSTSKISEFPLSFVLRPDGRIKVINLNESKTRFTIRSAQDVTFSGYKDAYVAAGLKVMAPGLSIEQDFMTVALEAVMTGGPSSTGFKLFTGNQIHGLSRFMAYGSRFDSAGELSVYGGGEAHQSLIATDYFINRETGIIDARSTMDAANVLGILSDHYVNDGKITAERLAETVESSYRQRGEVETSVDHTLGLSGEGHIAGSVKAKHFALEGGTLTLNKEGVLDMDTGSLDFDALTMEGDLRAENRLDLTGISLLVAESAKLFSRGQRLFADMQESLTIAGLVSAKLGIQLKSRGRLHHAITGIMASDGKVELDIVEGNLEGQYASLSKDSEGAALQLADLIIRSRGAFAYDPERLRAARLLDMTFVGVPDLRSGIRTTSDLRLSVDAGSGVMKLSHPILALGGTDFKAPGIDVVYEGDKASFESDGDISVESKSLDLRGEALSRRGRFTTSIEEALKVRSNIEAKQVHLKARDLSFYRGEVDPTAAASGAGGGGPIRTLPTVLATSDLGAEGASLVLDADTMNLTEAYLQTSGTLSIINKEEVDFRIPERFRANGYHIDTQGNIIIERPLRVEGEYGLRLLTPKTIRVGHGGHLIEVHTLRGPLELSAHLLDLKWAQLFSEQDMRLVSQTDVLLGAGVEETRYKHKDGRDRAYPFNVPNGAYLQTNGTANFYYANEMLIDNASVHIVRDMRLGHFDEVSEASMLKLMAGHLRVDGNAYIHVRTIANTIYDISRDRVYSLKGSGIFGIGYKNHYRKTRFDVETSRPSHLRIGSNLITDSLPNVLNVSSIANVIGSIILNGEVVSPTGFFRNTTHILHSNSMHKHGNWDCHGSCRTSTEAKFVVGEDASIPADSIIQTGRFRAGGIATFRGRHDFYSENIDPQGIVAGIRVTFPELDSVLFKRNPDQTGPVMIPRAPIRLGYTLPINPEFIFIAPNVRFSAANPVRQYLSPEAFDHVLAMQLGADIDVSKLTPPEMLSRLENNTRTFMEKGHLALPMSKVQDLLIDEEVKETQIISKDAMTSLSKIDPEHVEGPMIFWVIQMMDGIPTCMPAFIRRIDTTPTGHTSARRLELFYGNKIHLVGATVQGRESFKARAPRLLMEAAYYSTSRQIDNDTREDRQIPVRAAAVAGEGEELGDFDVKVDEALMAGARSRGRGRLHADRLRAVGATETTTVTRVKKKSGPFGGKDVDTDVSQRHRPELFEGELTTQGNHSAGMTGPHFEGRHALEYPQVSLRASQNRHHHTHQSTRRGVLIDTASVRGSDSVTFGSAATVDGTLRIAADDVLIEDSRMRPMDMDGIDLGAANIVRHWIQDRHSSYSDTHHSLSAVAQIGASIAFTCMTGGIGATWNNAFLAGAAQGASAATISHMVNAMVSGDSPLNSDLLEAIAFRAVTQGLTQGALHSAYGSINAEGLRVLPGATTFGGHLGRAAIGTGVHSGATWAVHGGRGSDVLTQAALSIAASTASSYGAYRTGQLYKGGHIGYGLHKVSHFLSAGTAASIINPEDRMAAFLSAGGAAVFAEAGMEWMFPETAAPSDSPVKIYDARGSSSVLEQRKHYAHQALRALSALGAAALGGNPFAADNAVDNAIRYNFLAYYAKPEFDEEGNLTGFNYDYSEIMEYGRIINRVPIPGVQTLIELTQDVPLITRNVRVFLSEYGMQVGGLDYDDRMMARQGVLKAPDISLGQTLDVILPHTFGDLIFDTIVGYATAGTCKVALGGYSATRARALGGLFGRRYPPAVMTLETRGASASMRVTEAESIRIQKLVDQGYTYPEAAFSIRIEPGTYKGSMSIDMSGFKPIQGYTAKGAPRNAPKFWQSWKERYPDTLSSKNKVYISRQKSPKVDSEWLKHFPEHKKFIGQTLEHHHLDHGVNAIPLPEKLHRGKDITKVWHDHRGGVEK